MTLSLPAVLVLLSAPAVCAAQGVDWSTLKADLPDSGRSQTQAVPGVPAQAPDLAQFRRNLLKASDNWQRDENSVKRSRVRVTAEGAYEVDWSAEGEAKFGNPDLAALPNGTVIINYDEILADRRRYDKLLQEAGLFERRDSEGVLRFYQSGAEVPSFTAFGRLAAEDFLDSQAQSLPASERDQLKAHWRERRLVPLALLPTAPGLKSRALRVYDGRSNELYELQIPAADPASPPTFLELHQGVSDARRYSP